MTVWQSLALVSPAQWAYAVGLAMLFWWRGPSPVAWVLLADFIALLAIAAAMDFQLIDRNGAHWSMLVVWVASVAVLATIPGAGRVIAAIGMGVIAFFLIALRFQFQFPATSAIVNAGAFIMLAVAFYGMGTSGGNGRGNADRPVSLGLSVGNHGLAAGGMAQGAAHLSADRGE